MNHTLCQLSYFAFHTQAQINLPGCSSTPIGEPWFLPQSVALPLVSLTPSLNICILYNVLRWIWTIDLLIFNQSHLPLSYQDFRTRSVKLRCLAKGCLRDQNSPTGDWLHLNFDIFDLEPPRGIHLGDYVLIEDSKKDFQSSLWIDDWGNRKYSCFKLWELRMQ